MRKAFIVVSRTQQELNKPNNHYTMNNGFVWSLLREALIPLWNKFFPLFEDFMGRRFFVFTIVILVCIMMLTCYNM